MGNANSVSNSTTPRPRVDSDPVDPAEHRFVVTSGARLENPGVWLVRAVRFVIGWLMTVSSATICIALSLVGLRHFAYLTMLGFWSKWVLRMCSVRLNVDRPQGLHEPAMFMSNHHSFIDVVFVVSLLPATSRFVVRKMLRQIPFFGWAAGDGLIALDLKKGKAAEALADGANALPDGWSVSIYPEGTRTQDGSLGRLKKGIFYMALQTRLPIVPVGSWGAASVIPARSIMPRSGPIEVSVGDPISTTDWCEEDCDEKMELLRRELLAVTERSRRRYEAAYGKCEPHRRVGSMWHELTGYRPPPA